MKAHSFSQEEIASHPVDVVARREWSNFKSVIDELGYEIRITGGTFLTHEINCDSADFETIKDLL